MRSPIQHVAWAWLLVAACGDDVPTIVDTEGPLPGGPTGAASTTGDTTSPTGDASTGDTGATPEPLSWPTLDCDPLAASYCAFPFPSNVFSTADESTETGRRVALPLEAFTNATNEPWEALDGFSPSSALLVHLPGAVADGLPGFDDFDASLGPDSATVILDAETGERVAHFAELDFATADAEHRTLQIRPTARLAGATRYIVAVRGVVDGSGQLVAPSPVFAALRDGTELAEEPSVESRRALYDDIFTQLDAAGVPRDTLQIAWDFTTASDGAVTERLLHMRDETFAALGDAAPAFTIDEIDPTFGGDDILFLARGTFQAPMYLTSAETFDGRLRLGEDGMPEADGELTVPFSIFVPASAEQRPAALLQHGHGLFGDQFQIEGSHFTEFATQYNHAVFAVNWMGMSDGDSTAIIGTIGSGSPTGLASMMDRLHQGTLNQLLAMRVVSAGLVEHEAFAGLLDAEQRYYYGISQGGILGGVYMGTSTEVTRGVLDVMGQPYNLLLPRSVDFDVFFEFLANRWPDGRDQQFVLAATQMLWDRVEPSGYTPFIREPFPDTPAHEVLMTAALGDHQVPTLGAHVMARSIPGLVHLGTGLREIWGLPSVQRSHARGSAYVEYDFGLPPDPVCSQPQTACDDPHSALRRLPAAREQIDLFLRTGEIRNFCPDGVCRFTEDNGCRAGERTPDVCTGP
ncbi:MAG: hypothetical protein AAF721_25540 [Myxococcota bacterium]